MNQLTTDITIEIWKLLSTKELMRTFIVSKNWKIFFLENIRNFKINASKTKITHKGLKNLKRVHTIDLSDCEKITDKGLKNLKGVHTIDLSNCIQISHGLENLKDPQHPDGSVWLAWVDINNLPGNLLPKTLSSKLLSDFNNGFSKEGEYIGEIV